MSIISNREGLDPLKFSANSFDTVNYRRLILENITAPRQEKELLSMSFVYAPLNRDILFVPSIGSQPVQGRELAA